MIARGFTRSVSMRTRRWDPSRDATSILSLIESVQNIVRLKWSIAIPSGLSKSVRRTHFTGQLYVVYSQKIRTVQVKLPDLMTAVGSPPSALALLIEGDVISVQ